MAAAFRIATFNLENFGGDTLASSSIEARSAVLRPQLVGLQADVLCLQEVNGQHVAGEPGRRLLALDRLLDGTPYADYRRAWTTIPEGIGALDVHNLVILSRFPILQVKQIQNALVPAIPYETLSVTAGPARISWDRPFLYAALELPGNRRLHVIDLHLRAPLASYLPGQKRSATAWKSISGWAEGFFISAIKRSGQALEARLFIDRLLQEESSALIAVCGDFNAEAHEMPVRIVRGDPSDSGNPVLAGQSLVALENPAADAANYSVLHEGRRLLLDHVLVSRQLALACRSVTIDNSALADEASATGHPEQAGSFHAPVVASFEQTAQMPLENATLPEA